LANCDKALEDHRTCLCTVRRIIMQ
jgi:hypothetical protein